MQGNVELIARGLVHVEHVAEQVIDILQTRINDPNIFPYRRNGIRRREWFRFVHRGGNKTRGGNGRGHYKI
jgi:hypothetical protein